MKFASRFALILVLVGFLGGAFPRLAEAEEMSIDQFLTKLSLSLRILALTAEKADETISLPLAHMAKEEVKDTWGAPREGGRRHEGQDIFAPKGTAVYSATAGYVTDISWNSLGGRTVSVVGRGGRSYYYAHLSGYAPNLRVGDQVTPETVLGYVGNSGDAENSPYHLHFGIYVGRKAINPLPLMIEREEKVARN